MNMEYGDLLIRAGGINLDPKNMNIPPHNSKKSSKSSKSKSKRTKFIKRK